MELQKYFESLHASLTQSANVKTVFGEPIAAAGKTIIPVARVRYGFGAGMGQGPTRRPGGEESSEQHLGQGGGGGAGLTVKPVGVVEVTASSTRFVPIYSRTKLFSIAALGFVAGWLFTRK